MDAANSGTRVLISGCGNGASVQDNNIGVGRGLRLVQALVGKLPLDGGAIGLSGAAAKVLHIKGRHRAIIAIRLNASAGTHNPVSPHRHLLALASFENPPPELT